MASRLEMKKVPIVGQRFCLSKHHPKNYKRIQLVYKIGEQDVEKPEKLDFLLAY